MSVRGEGGYKGLGFCALGLSYGIGEGGVSTHSAVSEEIIKLLVAKIN